MADPPSIEAIAYHEASHATIGRLLGIDGISIEISPDGKGGICHHGNAWPGSGAELAAQAAGLDRDLLMECAGARRGEVSLAGRIFRLGRPMGERRRRHRNPRRRRRHGRARPTGTGDPRLE
jgi:hypothetical protein